ncbi:MAG: hypothetical protein R2875_06005 [Desulfobacterales bacterium]
MDLSKDFTGRKNVFVLGALMDIPKDRVAARMEQVREFAGIGIFFDKPVRTYSSGMLARLAFAVYTNMEPDILIVDEAINVGDADFKRKCLDHVSALVEKGMALLLVSHSPLIVEQFCRMATVLKNGEIIFDGDVKTAIEEYNSSRPDRILKNYCPCCGSVGLFPKDACIIIDWFFVDSLLFSGGA